MSALSPARSENRAAALSRTRRRMGPFFRENQVLGRRNAIGCVALEITQRCNLDCTLCYLSENSERVKDIPLSEVYRRIDRIHEQFGAPTAVQITGGDPTLRKREELVAIVRRVRERGLLPTLMTNGIKATRDLLGELAEAGLNDVAFHVDLTQERKGYATEADLNAVREEYIERARGIPVAVIFNITVCRENFDEIPDMVRFFRRHADVVGMASFQLQADTGRGVLRERDRVISLETVRDQIVRGAGTPISWDTVLIGHPACHRIGVTLEANGNLFDLNDDPAFFNRFLADFEHVMLDRRHPGRAVAALLAELRRRPSWILRSLRFFGPKLWKMQGRSAGSEVPRPQVVILRPELHGRLGARPRTDPRLLVHGHEHERAHFDVRAQRPARRIHPEADLARHGIRAGHLESALRRHPSGRARFSPGGKRNRMKKPTLVPGPLFLAFALLFVLSAGCAVNVPPPATVAKSGPAAAADAQKAWASVLSKYVDENGRIDFVGMSKDRSDLDAYVAWVAATSPTTSPGSFPTKEAQLAYYINAYNALAMYNVIQSGMPKDLNAVKVRFFYSSKLPIGGGKMSLYDLENKIIRPMGDPRVHFALNCMVRGCPRLPREPFRADQLDLELEASAQYFLNEPRNVERRGGQADRAPLADPPVLHGRLSEEGAVA